MIEVELPDGTIAEFPDGTAPDVMKGALRKRFPPQQPAPTGILPQIGQGLVEGATDLVSFPARIGEWLGQKTTGAIDKYALGKSDEEIQAARQRYEETRSGIDPVGVADKINAMSGVGAPQTTGEKYARTISGFVPAAVTGPGGLIRKTAMAVIPGASTEAAGQAVEGTKAEPYVRMATALLTGLATGTMKGGNPIRDMAKSAPTHKAVIDTKNRLYKALENAGVKYDANAYQQWVADLPNKLGKINPKLHPQTSAVLDDLAKEVGTSPDFTTMDQLRQLAGDATRGSASTSPADLYKAGKVLKEVDQFFQGAPLISNGSIPAGEVNRVAKTARELARRNIMARDIKEMDRKSQYYLGGNESGQRNQFASYMKSPKGKLVTPVEEKAFNKVIRREGVENVLHNTGSRLASIGGMAATTATIPFAGALGPMVHGGAMAVNLGARKLMERITDKRVKEAIAVALSGRDAQSKALTAAQKVKADRIVRALLATESARKSGEQPFATDAKGNSYPYPNR